MQTNQKKPRIKVLLAAYNGADYIAEQLDSILSQTVPDIEILASDDGSTDGTREILQKYKERYPERILLRHHSGAAGGEGMPAPARNFFWLLSQAGDADYLMLSDQDDVWHRRKTEVLLAQFQKAEAAQPMVVFSDMEVVDAGLHRIAPSFLAYSRCNPDRTSFAEVLVENPVTGGALMMNRSMARLLIPAPAVCFMHDWWIALCAACFGKILCVRKPLYKYRQHESNVLGAQATGSLEDMKKRLTRGEQVEENYRRMFAQAAEFGRIYGRQMSPYQRGVLRAFLALPFQSPAGRFRNIMRTHFYKSSRLQTLAQCVTIPSAGEWEKERNV